MGGVFLFEKISIILSVIGLLGGLSSWIYIWLGNKPKFKCVILSKKVTPEGLLLYVSFSNESRLPIALTKIDLIVGNSRVTCVQFPEKVFEIIQKTKDVITHKEKHFSMQIPINISGLSATSGFVYFRFGLNTVPPISNVLTLEVSTNRGGINIISLELPPDNL